MELKTLFSKGFLHRVFVRDQIIFISVIFSFLLQVITWFFLIWRGLPLQSMGYISLHYTIYFGVDAFGIWYKMFFPALVGFLFFFINMIFALVLYEKERLFAHIFAVGSVLVEAMVLAISILIILLNI